MIVTLERGLKKAKVWLGELPDLQWPAIRTGEREIPVSGPRVTEKRSAALELRIPTGPFELYGTLGARFIPEPSGPLRVIVSIADKETKVYQDHETPSWAVKLGIPGEFAHTILDGTMAPGTTGLLGSGKLYFDRGATTHIGSSPSFFRRLTSTVLQLLVHYPKFPSEADLERIIGF